MLSEALKYRAALISGMAVLLWCVVKNAGVTADAFITFRVVDNAVHGYGLRWNIGERVQAYTNPLWMLLHIPFYAVWENIFVITIALGIACTLAAVLIAIRTFPHRWQPMLCLFIAPLCLSRSFIWFSTSGMENSLTHLLFAAFGWAVFRAPEKNRWFFISLFTALAMVNRLDVIIIYLPVLIYIFLSQYRRIRFRQCFLGGLPIVAWLAFSLFYYGFLFPNTKYAKLDTGIDGAKYMFQGFHYLLNLLALDFISALWLLPVCLAVPLWLLSAKMKALVSREMLCITLGVLFYSYYVIFIGGDYIAGRYWSLPVFASIWWVYAVFGSHISNRGCVLLAAALLACAVFHPYSHIAPLCSSCTDKTVLSDWQRVSLREYLHENAFPTTQRTDSPSMTVRNRVAIYGYEQGPLNDIIDTEALTDPLLARLPSQLYGDFFFAGHFRRMLPKGYLRAVQTGSLDEMDPQLAQYYDRLRFIIAGDLWDAKRVETIVRFNLGEYDYLRDAYIKSHFLNPL